MKGNLSPAQNKELRLGFGNAAAACLGLDLGLLHRLLLRLLGAHLHKHRLLETYRSCNARRLYYRALADELGIGTSHTKGVVDFLVFVRLGDLVGRNDRRRLDNREDISNDLATQIS